MHQLPPNTIINGSQWVTWFFLFIALKSMEPSAGRWCQAFALGVKSLLL